MSRQARFLPLAAVSLVVTAVIACCAGVSGVSAPANDGTPSTASQDSADTIDKGRRLAKAKACLTCHSIDGREMLGPTWQGLFGSAVRIEDAGTVEVDDAYLRQSITDPGSMIVEGFDDIMTVVPLKEDEVDAVIAYIKTLE